MSWQALDHELDLWQRADLTLPLWWRDDDAVSDTAQLRQLSALAQTLALPVHLAVIPNGADDTLARAVANDPLLIPMVHGWAHQNHAPADQKKAEFGAHRPSAQMLAETAQGLHQLQQLFGPRLLPIFVPPWNRVAPEITAGLAAQGYRALSTFTPRAQPQAAPGLAQINTHLDPIDWKDTRSAHPADRLLSQLTAQLRDRREARADNDEPYGILTHHLVHDAAIWQITTDILRRLLEGPAQPTCPLKGAPT